MAENTSLSLTDAIDEVWFHQNIILPYHRKRIGGSSGAPQSLPLECCLKLLLRKSSASKVRYIALYIENSSLYLHLIYTFLAKIYINSYSGLFLHKSTPEKKNKQPLYKEKKPAKLSIIIGQPVLQLHASPPPPPQSRIRRNLSQMRSYKSLSDLENYELKGFRDLGFMFRAERSSPRMMSMIPGLERRVENRKGSDEKRSMEQEKITRPHLLEAWLVNRYYPPLLNLWTPPNSPGETNMKKQLRFWARNVASSVQSMDPSKVDMERRDKVGHGWVLL